MKMRFEFPNDTRSGTARRGAAPVGFLHELPQVELAAIVYLRAWCEGEEDRQIIGKDFRLVMGNSAGDTATDDFDTLMDMLLNNARRPVMRHGLACRCFGGDESAFAHMVAAAAGQDREDAMLFASTLVTGQAAWAIAELAMGVGQVFLRLASIPDLEATHNPRHTKYKH